jgi:iron-sulfur cluster insertion protein
MTEETTPTDSIIFTDGAVSRITEIMAEEDDPDLKLRIFVEGGGCSGFQYGFTLDTLVNDDDFTLEKGGVQFLIDAMSMQYLVGSTVDYVDDLTGSMFKITNPAAVSTCGCGSSFSL